MKLLLNRGLLIFVLFLGLTALACNLPFGGEETPTPRPTRQSAIDENSEVEATPDDLASDEQAEEDSGDSALEQTEEEAADLETAVSDDAAAGDGANNLLSGLFQETVSVRDAVQEFDKLESYQMQFDFSTTVNEVSQLVQATLLVSTKPAASQITFSFSGFDGMPETTSMDMTQLDGVSYVNMAELGCVSSTDGDVMDGAFDTALNANEFLDNVGEATLVGEETVNGIEALHYTFDETAVDDETTQMIWAQGNVYIAKQGNFVVRFQLQGEGTVDNLGLGVDEAAEDSKEPQIGFIQVEMNVTNINEPVDITIPVECENNGIDNADFPVLEDAVEFTSFGGFVSYKTETRFSDAVQFYQERMAADGWTYQETASFIVDGTTALMFFEKDGRSLTVTVTEDSESTVPAFLVVIFEE